MRAVAVAVSPQPPISKSEPSSPIDGIDAFAVQTSGPSLMPGLTVDVNIGSPAEFSTVTPENTGQVRS